VLNLYQKGQEKDMTISWLIIFFLHFLWSSINVIQTGQKTV
jgi:hypothetical protein